MKDGYDIGAYEDLLYLPRPVSQKRRPMPRANRAAQFAPFAALTGFDDVIDEEARLTEHRIELDESQKEELDRMLLTWIRQTDGRATVAVTYFVPDDRKAGGKYVTLHGRIKRIEGHTILLLDGTRIRTEDILSLRIE